MRYAYDMYKYLIVAHKDLSEEYFLEKSGVFGGYAQELFLRIYKSLIAESEDVKHVYESFYLDEYTSYKDFIAGYYALKEESVEKIMETLNSNPSFRLYDYKSLSVGENFDDFITSESVYERFLKLLLMEV